MTARIDCSDLRKGDVVEIETKLAREEAPRVRVAQLTRDPQPTHSARDGAPGWNVWFEAPRSGKGWLMAREEPFPDIGVQRVERVK